MGSGVVVSRYRTDNGVFIEKGFLYELKSTGQSITQSGIFGHHHNGVAENCIRNTVRMARTMSIHCSIRWPECAKKELWTLEMDHGVYLYNHMPCKYS